MQLALALSTMKQSWQEQGSLRSSPVLAGTLLVVYVHLKQHSVLECPRWQSPAQRAKPSAPTMFGARGTLVACMSITCLTTVSSSAAGVSRT